jgi:biopolymer transport protein ExbB/TolQ
MQPQDFVSKVTSWVGSLQSLIIHTGVFAAFFALSFAGFLSWDLMFLILTTIVSLEAIYLAIFIQMTVNRQAAELAEVSEDVEDIQEDIEEISEDVDEIQGDIDEIQEDVEEISEDDEREDREEEALKQRQAVTLETLSRDVQQLLKDLEALKHDRP